MPRSDTRVARPIPFLPHREFDRERPSFDHFTTQGSEDIFLGSTSAHHPRGFGFLSALTLSHH